MAVFKLCNCDLDSCRFHGVLVLALFDETKIIQFYSLSSVFGIYFLHFVNYFVTVYKSMLKIRG